MNCTMVFQANINLLKSYGFFSSDLLTATSKIFSENVDSNQTMNMTGEGTLDFFRHMTDLAHKRTRAQGLIVCVFELSLLMYYLGQLLMHLIKIITDKGYTRWSNVAQLTTETIPVVATFSALKMMRLVHPALVTQQMVNFLQEHSKQLRPLYILIFILTRVVCLVFGVIVFALKLLDVGIQLMHPNGSSIFTLFATCAFLNQCMGIVYLDDVLQQRLFLFIFGGSDAEFQDEERVLKHVYMARLMRACWTAFGDDLLGRVKGFLLITTMDHYDIQKLIISEDEGLKKRATQVGPDSDADGTTEETRGLTSMDRETELVEPNDAWGSSSAKKDK